MLPVCNAESVVKETVKSLLSQSYKNIEVIAIDDASRDASYALLRTFKKKYKRVRAYKNKKRYGLAVCLNRAIKRTKGSFVVIMDQNDIITKDKIKRQVNFLIKNPQIAAVGTQSVLINEKGKKLGKSNFPTSHEEIIKGLLNNSSLQFETAMINKKLLPKDLLSFKQQNASMLLHDLFMKILSYGEVANLPWILHYKRKITGKSNTPAFFHQIKLWVKSVENDYKLPFHYLFTPLLKQN